MTWYDENYQYALEKDYDMASKNVRKIKNILKDMQKNPQDYSSHYLGFLAEEHPTSFPKAFTQLGLDVDALVKLIEETENK